MKLLGLDIGTTTVSAAVVEDGRLLDGRTQESRAFLPAAQSFARVQDPAVLRDTALAAVEALLDRHPDVAAIGVTGQMHGIVYLDGQGRPVSPLYTWLDGRGDQPRSGKETYAAYLTRNTGLPAATGWGLVTHFYNLENGLVPGPARTVCTIHDYVAMVLAGADRPVTDRSDAASLGFFDVQLGAFRADALEAAGIDPAILPALAEGRCIGRYRGRIPVAVAIGDNQASFLGASGGAPEGMLVNFGTGSQFSVYTPAYMACPGLETRPFPGGGYLLVGASLCGGRAYALLERFFRDTAQAMTGAPVPVCYDAMARLLESGPEPEDLPRLSPLFQGTRRDPALRAEITCLDPDNFTPRHLLWAMLEGMTGELLQMYESYLSAGGQPARLLGSGNGLRKNIHLQRCVERAFGQSLRLPPWQEEAACGAALFAAGACL